MRVRPGVNRILGGDVDVERQDLPANRDRTYWMDFENVSVVVRHEARVLEETAEEASDGNRLTDRFLKRAERGGGVLELAPDVRLQWFGSKTEVQVAIVRFNVILAACSRFPRVRLRVESNEFAPEQSAADGHLTKLCEF